MAKLFSASIHLISYPVAVIYMALIFLLWIPNHIYKLIVVYFAKKNTKFGVDFKSFGAQLADKKLTQTAEHFTEVISLTLEGDLSLENLRKVFTQNVLDQVHPTHKNKKRYPELKQNLVSWMGYSFWKDDPNFQIENHIFQLAPETLKVPITDLIYTNPVNKPFLKDRSPWDLSLIRDFQTLENPMSSGNKKTLLILRIHHALADGLSILKLLVESLAGKKVKAAIPQSMKLTMTQKIFQIVFFPFSYLAVGNSIIHSVIKYWRHPWTRPGKNSPLITAISSPFPLSEVKQVAKSHGVTVSALLMTLVSESMSRFLSKRGKIDLYPDTEIAYLLPKPNHPPILTNHMYQPLIPFPNQQLNITDKLHQSNEIFIQAKKSMSGLYMDILLSQISSLIAPLRQLIFNTYLGPVAVTNFASDEEGFSVGGLPCTNVTVVVGPTVVGVMFVILTNKGDTTISLITSENILSEEDAKEIVASPEHVLQLLKDKKKTN